MQLTFRQSTFHGYQSMSEQYETIIVPLDGSPEGAKCLPTALRLARQFDARLLLVRVIAPSSPMDVEPDTTRPGPPTEREYGLRRAQAEGYLDALKRWLRTRDVDVDARVAVGVLSTAVLEIAMEQPKPLVVLRSLVPSTTQRAAGAGPPDGLSHALAQADIPAVFVSDD